MQKLQPIQKNKLKQHHHLTILKDTERQRNKRQTERDPQKDSKNDIFTFSASSLVKVGFFSLASLIMGMAR